jgi:predicted transcriptional regulator
VQVEPVSEVRIRDLVLTDEHDTVELEDSLVDAAKKLLSLPRGILVALDGGKVKGVLTSIQILSAVAEGSDMEAEN